MPVAPLFARDEQPDPELARHCYFVVCSTLEPRKNHLLILHVWRELVRRRGQAAPKLLLIGERGWENENIVDLLDRCRQLREHVLEISGLPTPSFKRILRGARALLMPSFAEGYGLPVAEALAAGTPVIASEIAVFREIAGRDFVGLSPIDRESWLGTIERFADGEAARRPAPQQAMNLASYFRGIDDFFDSL